MCPPSLKIVPPGARRRDLLLAGTLDRVFSVSHLFKSTVKKNTESEKGGFERGEKPALEHIPYIASGENWRKPPYQIITCGGGALHTLSRGERLRLIPNCCQT